jgi:hypothetical protein
MMAAGVDGDVRVVEQNPPRSRDLSARYSVFGAEVDADLAPSLRGIITSRSLRDRVRLWRTGDNGDNRIRTGDPLLAKQVLYQLSYVPGGTKARSGRTLWWAREDLNLRPHAYQACALTN